MITFLAGGTGTPKLLGGATEQLPAERLTVVGNTGDDIELGGLLVCPDIDTVLFHEGDTLDTDRWWGIDGDTHETNAELHRLAAAAGLETGPQYLPAERQTEGRSIARWRRFSGIAEFMTIGDRDRAVHITRTSLLDEGHTLTEATQILANAFDVELSLLPMSDDPVATIIRTDSEPIHFQEYWLGEKNHEITGVEFRGSTEATPTDSVLDALDAPVVIGPSNPVTSIGPMRSIPGIEAALDRTPVVAVSPFIEGQVFSGPAAELMAATGRKPSTQGIASAYPFVDAFVLDSDDGTELDRPVIRTDTRIDDAADSNRVMNAVIAALTELDIHV